MAGAGGAIGFVKPFTDRLNGAPCIPRGVADPNSRAPFPLLSPSAVQQK